MFGMLSQCHQEAANCLRRATVDGRRAGQVWRSAVVCLGRSSPAGAASRLKDLMGDGCSRGRRGHGRVCAGGRMPRAR